MNKFDLTTLSELTSGDRFYFPSKNNRVCTFLTKSKALRPVFEYEDQGIVVKTEINRKAVFLRNINKS